MEELQDFSEKKESNLDLKAELYKYLKYWHWLLIGCLVGLTAAFLYNRYTIPKYATESSMMMLSKEDNTVAGVLPSGGSSVLSLEQNSIQNQIETLKSKRLIEKVIDELDLNISYFLEGKVIAVEVYKDTPVKIEFITPEEVVHNSSLDIIVDPGADGTYTLMSKDQEYLETFKYGEPVIFNGLEFVIHAIGENIGTANNVNIKVQPLRYVAVDYEYRMNIFPKGEAKDILSLYLTGAVPQKSQDYLNSLMFHFNADGVADKRQVAENTAAFIQERLQIISEELDSVEGGIADFKRENRIMDIASSAGEYKSKSSLAEEQIFKLETQLMILDALKDALTSAQPYRLLPANMGISEGGLSTLISQYNTLVLERNALLKTSTTKNPVIKGITEELDAMKENLLDNVEGSKRSLNIQLRELNQLDRKAEGQFSNFPGLEKGMRGIVRQQQIKEQLYLFLLQRREESAISFAATGPVAKIIDPAFTYNDPVGPEPWIILTGGGVVGFLIPLLVIFGVNFLDNKVHHKGDLKPITNEIPFLGEVPKVASDQQEVIQINDRSPLAESFRILRTNLAYLVQSRNKDKAEVIFVTSTIKGEGKTFISFNLARTLSSSGKKVLLIGADIRNPKLHKFSNNNLETKGLSDYLYDHDIQSEDIITTTNQDDLKVDVIFSGAIPPNPAELFMNDRLKNLLQKEEGNYDYIILDTAPTMIVTDTLLISPLADTTLYVTRAGYTEKKLLEFPKDLKVQGKLKGVAVVLNDVDYKKFSYGGKYGYAYGYGYGYGADEDKGLMKYFTRKK